MTNTFSVFNVITIVLFASACITAINTLYRITQSKGAPRDCCGQSYRYHVVISLATLVAGLGFIYAQYFSPIPITERVWSFVAVTFGFQYMMNAKFVHHSAVTTQRDNKQSRKSDNEITTRP